MQIKSINKLKFMQIFFMVLVLALIIITSWISDDAAITLKTVLNFNNGYGAVFNVGERVQAYTHPLWFILLSAFTFITQNVFTTIFVLSIATTLFAIWILFNESKNLYILAILFISVFFSRSFISFSSSGLENPLSHLLIALLIFIAIKTYDNNNMSYGLSFLTGLAFLVRPDLILVTIPVWLTFLYKNLSKNIKEDLKMFFKHSLTMLSSIIIWSLISIIYYGSIVPNTAYAKTGAGIPRSELLYNSYIYLIDLAYRDPITLIVILLGIFFGLISKGLAKVLSLSIILYLLYVMFIGGDFMSGRFFTVPFFIALFILAHTLTYKKEIYALSLLVLVTLLGFSKIEYSLFMQTESNYSPQKYISDERHYYYKKNNIISVYDNYDKHIKDWDYEGFQETFIVCGGLGFKGISYGPNVFLIDQCALTDPLLSRLPADRKTEWSMGHFYRQIPTDYKDSIEQNKNIIFDPETKEMYRHVREVTRGEIFTSDWFTSLWKINTENFIGQKNKEEYKYGTMHASSSFIGEGFYQEKIIHTKIKTPASIIFILTNNAIYTVEFKINGEYIIAEEIATNMNQVVGDYLYEVKVEPSLEIENIRIRAVGGGPRYNIELLEVNQ